MRRITLVFLCVTLVSAAGNSAFALDFSRFKRLIVFGDSLSDNGNSLALAGQPALPYGQTFDGTNRVFPGRWTDGQNWVDYFPLVAKHFGSITPFFADPDGTNVAIGGATSADLLQSVPTGFPAEIPEFLSVQPGHRISDDDLCVIWIGANDFAAQIAPRQTVTNIRQGITALAEAGARHFLLIDVPDISLTPVVKSLGAATVQEAKQFVVAVNVLLAAEIPLTAWLERVHVDLIDINAIFVPLVLNPAFFGFSNSVEPAFVPPAGPLAADPNRFVFWDPLHPTTNAHLFAARFIYRTASPRFDFSVLSSR